MNDCTSTSNSYGASRVVTCAYSHFHVRILDDTCAFTLLTEAAFNTTFYYYSKDLQNNVQPTLVSLLFDQEREVWAQKFIIPHKIWIPCQFLLRSHSQVTALAYHSQGWMPIPPCLQPHGSPVTRHILRLGIGVETSTHHHTILVHPIYQL